MSSHRFAIRVKPGASRAYVGGAYGEPLALVVSVNAQPVDGKASDAVVDALAKAFGVATRDVQIVSGHTARTKHVVVSVSDELDSDFAKRLQELIGATL